MIEATGRSGWLPSGVGGWVLPILVGLIGLLMAHHPMILSHLTAIQTDPVDSRLINYILEHSYLWVRGDPSHLAFWSPPFFFPARNVGAYSDVLLTVAPIYWAVRVAGAPPDSAFQVWMILISALNYGSAFGLFRQGFRFATGPATVGAFLVAFGAPRVNQLGHQQLVPVFFGVATLFALARLFSSPRPSRWSRWVWWEVAVLSVVAQLYGGFYNGWFLILALGFCACWMLALPGMRGPFCRTLGHDAPAILVALAVGGVVLEPFLTHYQAAARELGNRDFRYVQWSILQPWSWLSMGPDHWLWGWSAKLDLLRRLPMPAEHRVGIGLVTPSVCAAGWYLGRDRPLVRIAALVALTLMLVATDLPGLWIANLGVVVVLLVTARFYHDRSQPSAGLVVLGALILLATCEQFPSWRVIGLTLFVIALCLAEAFRERRRPARWVPPVVLILWLCCKLFDLQSMGISLALVVPVVVIIERLRPPDRAAVRLAGMGVWLLALIGITYPDQPQAIGIVMAAPVALLTPGFRRWPGVAHRPLAIAVVVALWAVVLLEHENSLWIYIYEFVPGGTAIRAVGRTGLVVLVPAAIGCAALFATPWAARRPWLAGLLAACCIIEQGVTTPSYDKLVARERIAALRGRVDRSASAFFYRPSNVTLFEYHLDAMWMSLLAGVPTVNGYSGGNPPGWNPLLQVDFQGKIRPREALSAWLDLHHLNPDRIQTIGTNE